MQIGAGYIRVSTEDQLEFSPDAQKRAIQEYAKKNQILLKDSFIFVDEGISGRKAEKRPSFMQMITMAKKKPRPFDVILVHKFDRFARNREDSVVYKSLLRKECGIKVISITEQLEDDKFSIILESMLEAMAEYYSLNLSDEVKKGMFEKARRGEHIGKAPYGYLLQNQKLIPHPYEFDIVKKIFDLYVNHGYSLTNISRYLNDSNFTTKQGGKWRNDTIKYILQNHFYTGITRYNYAKSNGSGINNPEDWILAPGKHLPAVSENLFQKAQTIIQTRSSLGINNAFQNNKTNQLHSWCQQLTVCAQCNKKLTLHSCNHGKYFSFTCRQSSSGLCSMHGSWSNKKLENLVIHTIKRDMYFPCILQINKKIYKTSFSETAILSQRLKKIADKKELIKKAYLAEIDTLEEYKKNKQELEKEEASVSKQITIFKKNALSSKPITTHFIQNFADLLTDESISIEEKNLIAKQFIKQIRFNFITKEIQIIYYAI